MEKRIIISAVLASLMSVGLQAYYEGVYQAGREGMVSRSASTTQQAPPSTTTAQKPVVTQAPPSTTAAQPDAQQATPPSTTPRRPSSGRFGFF